MHTCTQEAHSEMEILLQGVRREEIQEIQLKIANEKLCISVGIGTCRVDVELRRRRVTLYN